ncbi:MAG: hypothetical protein N2Z21_04270 [Candidatus Sumerlaeaceae bacterium]|nr:hypothetical protein [Candidatus Sumerlaeaceae bacterium]
MLASRDDRECRTDDEVGRGPAVAVILAALLCGLWAPLLVARLCSFDSLPGHPRSDFEYYFYPLHCFLKRNLAVGTIPFWNYHLFSGYPVIESVQSALLYPFNTLALLLTPTAVHSLVSLTVFHFLANFAAWYWCLRYAFCFAPVVSALVAAFPNITSVMPYRLFSGHLTVIFTLPWFPVLIASAYRIANCSRGIPWISLAAVAVGLVIVAGAPQYSLFAIWCFLTVCGVATSRKYLLRTFSRALAAVTLGGILASPQIIATTEYLPFSARSGSWSPLSVRAGALTTLLETLFFAPFGNGVTEYHVNERGAWDTAGYIGTLALVLAVSGFIARNGATLSESKVRRCAFSLVVMGLYLLGGGWLPGFDRIRENQRAIFIVHTGLFLSLATGLNALLGNHRSGEKHSTAAGRRFTALLFMTLCFSLLMQSGFASQFGAFWEWFRQNCAGKMVFTPQEQIESAMFVWNASQRALNWTVAWLAIGCAVAMASRWLKSWGPILLAGFGLLDPLLSHLAAYETRTSVATMGPPHNIFESLEGFCLSQQELRLGPARVIFPNSLTNSAQCFEGIGETGGYDPLMPRLALARRNYSERQIPMAERKRQLHDIFGVGAQIIEPFSQPEFVPPKRRIMQLHCLRESCHVSVTTVTRTFQLQPSEHLFGPIENTTHTVEHQKELATILAWCSSDSNALHGIANGLPTRTKWYRIGNENSIYLLCSTPRNSVLILSATWLPWWRVYSKTDSAEKPLKVNGWMTGVLVQKGISMLRLEYVPPAWRITVFSMLCGVLLVVTGIFSSRAKAQPVC